MTDRTEQAFRTDDQVDADRLRASLVSLLIALREHGRECPNLQDTRDPRVMVAHQVIADHDALVEKR